MSSSPFAYPSNDPPVMVLCVMPSPATVYQASNFSISVSASEVNASGNATVTLGTLPSGVTTSTSTAPLSSTGAILHLQASNSIAAGFYDIPLTATDDGAVVSGDFKFTLSTGPVPNFFITAGKSGSQLAARGKFNS